jgi:hypothetical protein
MSYRSYTLWRGHQLCVPERMKQNDKEMFELQLVNSIIRECNRDVKGKQQEKCVFSAIFLLRMPESSFLPSENAPPQEFSLILRPFGAFRSDSL